MMKTEQKSLRFILKVVGQVSDEILGTISGEELKGTVYGAGKIEGIIGIGIVIDQSSDDINRVLATVVEGVV